LKTEDGRPETEDGRPETEDRRPKTEDRSPKSEDGRLKTEPDEYTFVFKLLSFVLKTANCLTNNLSLEPDS
jgi:hypothetical protein